MGVAYFIFLVVCYLIGYLHRDDVFVLTVAVGIGTLAFPPIAARAVTFRRGFVIPTLLSSSVMRRSQIRVSFSYLIAIEVDGEQLLVRGRRIETQYQPVGGVFKRRPDAASQLERYALRSDPRFDEDDVSKLDLRGSVPGKNLHRLLRWFDTQKDREIFPWREFHEELVAPGLLDAVDFAYFDCSYLGRRRLPFRRDRYSGLWQLIVAEVYWMHPNPRQAHDLRDLKQRVENGEEERVQFVTRDQIRYGGDLGRATAKFDIPPTAQWLLSS